MLDPAITDFFKERKEGWLKKKLSANSNEEEAKDRTEECDQLFSLENWLPDAARRAKQLTVVSHPGKFSHPSAKASSIIADIPFSADGFLRSGNAVADADVFGNAAALDVYKFLSLQLSDGRDVLQHLEEESDAIKQQFAIQTCSFPELKEGFLTIKTSNSEPFTSDLVKQVYFPADDDYHLLSILSPSGLMFAMRRRIDEMRFSDAAKEAREHRQKQQFHETGYDDLPQLTVIGFGGTKPQNISVLNSQHGGKAYLLNSMPPQIEVRNVRLPKRNFLGESFRLHDWRDILSSLHGLFKLDINNLQIREKISQRINEFIDRVVDRMWQVRMAQHDARHPVDFKQLIEYQRTWLDPDHAELRESDSDWLDKLTAEMARWLVRSYQKSMGKKAVMLGDTELLHIRTQIEKNREALR